MMPSDIQSAALLAHIASQTKSNLDFLVSQNYISATDAAGITAQLASLANEHESSTTNTVLSLTERTQQLSFSNGDAGAHERAPSPPKAIMPTRRNIPPPPAPRPQQARAVWDYNVDGSDPNDLTFRSGDIIELVSETNADWWTGKLNGRQGLFPSNYVEKIAAPRSPSPATPTAVPVPAPNTSYGRAPSYSSPSPNPSFPSPGFPSTDPGSYNAPPPPPPQWQHAPPPGPPTPYGGFGGYNNNEKQQQMSYGPPPGAPAPPPEQQAPPQPEKKKKFGGLGKTMATSAAGGVGFGAGAAVGSGIINAIF